MIAVTRKNSFTLVELLVVMGVIAILSAITLGASGAIQNKAARSRAAAEIATLGSALESYKVDNGIYPGTNSMITVASTAPTAYTPSAQILYRALSGGLTDLSGTPSATVYMSFKKNQLNSTTSCYVVDPFGYAYGYTTNAVMNVGFFDLWSTAGKSGSTQGYTNQWINNWQAN